MGTPTSTSPDSGKLKRSLDDLGHGVVHAEVVERGRVAGVAGARDDREIRLFAPRPGDDRLNGLRRVEGHDKRLRGRDPACAQKLGRGGLAVVTGLPSRRRAATTAGSASTAMYGT